MSVPIFSCKRDILWFKFHVIYCLQILGRLLTVDCGLLTIEIILLGEGSKCNSVYI